MTAQRMRQHLGCLVWHARAAIAEAPSPAHIPALIRQVDVTGLEDVIDAGHIAEAADRDTHLLPEEVRQGKQE
jgi:hypothetical protein